MSEENKVVDEAQATEDQAQASTEPVQLTINDLQGLAAVIDLSVSRGAFKAGELEQVGSIYNKLASFLGYVGAQVAAEKEAQAESAEDEKSE